MFQYNDIGLIKEQEQKKDDLTVIDSMTLENTLKLLELKSLLSDLDDNLREVKKGKKTIEDHRKYFKTEVYDKLTKLCLIYHPDIVQRQGGSDEEILIAEAIQKKITTTRDILENFNENFAQEGDFKYSSFSKIKVNFLGNEEKVNEITYATLNKLKGLHDFKHDNFILNLNGFLRSSQASIKGFIANDFDCFLKKKSNAERYFRNYLNGQYMLFNHLESFRDQCKQDNCMNAIADQMLAEHGMQGNILIQIDEFLNQSSSQRQELIKSDDAENRQYLYCIKDKQSYKQADKDTALPFVEYVNVLAICNEIYNKIKKKEMSWCAWISSNIPGFNYFVSMNYLIGSEVIRKIVADNEITKNSDDLLLLHKLSNYLLTYYCYGNKENGKLAAELLDINFNLLGEEDALQLLAQVIEVCSNYLEKEFRPEKDFFYRITEVQMKFFNDMQHSLDELCENMRQHNQQFVETNSEIHQAHLAIRQAHLERNKIIEKYTQTQDQAIKCLTEYLEDRRKERQEAREKHQELMNKMEQEINERRSQREQERNETQAQMDMILKLLKARARANAAAQKQQAGPSNSGEQTAAKPAETDPNSQVDQPTASSQRNHSR